MSEKKNSIKYEKTLINLQKELVKIQSGSFKRKNSYNF